MLLTDTQSVLLSSAAQRETGSIYPLPATITASPGPIAKSLASLAKRSLAEERETSTPEEVSRVDGTSRYGMFITTAGRVAIGVEDEPTVAAEPPAVPAAKGTKTALVLGMLGRSDGATLTELVEATGWLPHTTRAALTGLRKKGHMLDKSKRDGATGLRIPAREIETLVLNRVATLFDDPIELVATAWLDVPAERYADLHQRCQELAARLRQRKPDALTMLGTVRAHDTRIDVTCRTDAIATALDVAAHPDAPETITLTDHVRLTRSGRAMRLVQGDGQAASASPDRSLVKPLLQARRWWGELRQGEIDITRLAEREKVSPAYVTRVVRLAFLSPKVVEAILAGRQCANVTAKALTLDTPPTASWKQQAITMLPQVREVR